MKGFPKTISTGQDLFNCLALVKSGELSREDMLSEIERIENRRFLHCPVMEINDDRKTVTIRYCNEVEDGQIVNGAAVSGVEHTMGEDDTPESTVITLKKPLPDEVAVLLIPSPVNPLDELGITQAQFDGIKEALEA